MNTDPRPFTPAEAASFADDYVDVPVDSSTVVYEGAVFDIVRDTFTLPEAQGTIVRDVVKHPGAVAVVALNEDNQVLLIQQYRHPVAARDWEIPAGLLDVPGEDPLRAAARELAEEADLEAATWHVLADQMSTPGGNSELLRIYLARDLTVLPAAEREEEELGIIPRWVDLADAVTAALQGRLTNATAMIGLLHLHAQQARDYADLRPADAAWPARAHLRQGLLATLPTRLEKRGAHGQARR